MRMFELLPRPLGKIFRKLTHLGCNSPFTTDYTDAVYADTDIARWEKTSVSICVPRSGYQCYQWFTTREVHHRLHRCGLCRHGYRQMGENIRVYLCPAKRVSVLSVVHYQRGSPQIAQMRLRRHRYPQIGEKYPRLSVSAEGGISAISGSETAWRDSPQIPQMRPTADTDITDGKTSVSIRVPRSGYQCYRWLEAHA